MQVITYNGSLYAFQKKENEINKDAFIRRCWFIVKNIDRFENYEYLETLSHVWVCCKYLNVTYDEDIMKELERCESP